MNGLLHSRLFLWKSKHMEMKKIQSNVQTQTTLTVETLCKLALSTF